MNLFSIDSSNCELNYSISLISNCFFFLPNYNIIASFEKLISLNQQTWFLILGVTIVYTILSEILPSVSICSQKSTADDSWNRRTEFFSIFINMIFLSTFRYIVAVEVIFSEIGKTKCSTMISVKRDDER